MNRFWPLLLLLSASLVYGGERPTGTAIETDHFTVSLPVDWQVKLASQDTNGWTYAFLDGTNEVFKASVWEGTGFLDCFCAPWDKYKVIKRENEEVRTIRMGDDIRTLKIAGKSYSLDIHASHKGYDKRLVDRILVSIRMKKE